MGDDDEDDAYGEEGYKRAQEEEYDFMWRGGKSWGTKGQVINRDTS